MAFFLSFLISFLLLVHAFIYWYWYGSDGGNDNGNDADIVRTIDSWMCELAAWKLSDLFDVASRLHTSASVKAGSGIDDAFSVARGVLSGRSRSRNGNRAAGENLADEVARVKACRDRLVQLIVESRHRHLRRCVRQC